MRERITDLPILDLKLPSSVNQLWRTRRGKVFRSSTYDAWRKEACWELLAQRPGRVEGPVEVSIALGRPDARKRHLDNAAGKTVLDLRPSGHRRRFAGDFHLRALGPYGSGGASDDRHQVPWPTSSWPSSACNSVRFRTIAPRHMVQAVEGYLWIFCG